MTSSPCLPLAESDAPPVPPGAGMIAMPGEGPQVARVRPHGGTAWEDTDASTYPGLYSLARDYLRLRGFAAAISPDRPGSGLAGRALDRLRGSLEFLMAVPSYPAVVMVWGRRLRLSGGMLEVMRLDGVECEDDAPGPAAYSEPLAADSIWRGGYGDWRSAHERHRARLSAWRGRVMGWAAEFEREATMETSTS